MSPKPSYRFILAGAGCAGLSLAYHLVQSPLAKEKILLIDRDAKTANDRTWCFWDKPDHPFQSIVYKSWQEIAYVDPQIQRADSIAPLCYQMIRSSDYYAFVKAELAKHPNVEFLQGQIQQVGHTGDNPFVQVGKRKYTATQVFNSTFNPAILAAFPRRKNAVWQHFKGWIIQTPTDCFDPEKALLMDFRTGTPGIPAFFYVLPFDQRSALVEYTLFTDEVLSPQVYERELNHYIQTYICPDSTYTVLESESGKIPMSDGQFDKRLGRGLYQIGTTGGAVKPSTGYAFQRIQQESRIIVDNLVQGLDPLARLGSPRRYQFYDRLFLEILQTEQARAAPIFQALFRHIPPRDILTFMGEQSTLLQEARIFWRLPWRPFLQAIPKVYGYSNTINRARKLWLSKIKLQKEHVPF